MAIIISVRKFIKGTAGRIFMGLVFLTMFGGIGLSGIIFKFFKGNNFEGIAMVNGVEISRQLFQTTVAQEDRQISYIRQQYGKNADLYMKIMGINPNPQINAANRLIHTELDDQFAQNMDIHIAHGYLEARLADPRFLMQEAGEILPQEVFTAQGSLDIYAALEYLKGTGQMPLLEKQLADKLKKQFAVLMLQSAFFVPSYAIKALYAEKKQAKKFSYQTFSLDTFLASEKTKGATDEQLKAFYNEQNKLAKRYWTPETRTATLWTFLPENFGISVEKNELDVYYNKNKSTRFVKDPLQIKVREIVFDDLAGKGLKTLTEEATMVRGKLTEDPAAFEALAKEYSSNKKTANNGGLVDFFKRGTHEKEYEKAAFKLKEDGEISPVVQVEKGFIILQRVARKDATFESFDAVKDVIEKTLLEQKFKSEFTKQANQLSRQENPQEARDSFISAHHGTKTTMSHVKKDSEDPIEQRLFALRNEGEFNAFVMNGKGIIVQLETRKKTETAPFDTVKSKVAADFYEAQATKALEAAVKESKNNVLKNKTFSPIDGGKISSTQLVKMDDEEKIKELAEIGFTEECFNLDWQGAVLSSFSPKNGIVIRLDELEELDENDLKEKKPEILKIAFERNNSVFSQAFIASLFRTATIKVNNSISSVKD
jgi:parvulin-like peptidyl-prolyl isomerase